jgi:hypothetical protein
MTDDPNDISRSPSDILYRLDVDVHSALMRHNMMTCSNPAQSKRTLPAGSLPSNQLSKQEFFENTHATMGRCCNKNLAKKPVAEEVPACLIPSETTRSKI